LVVTSLLMWCSASAHEIGTTQVRFTLHEDRTWSAAITTAPQALVNKLEAEAGQPRSSDLDADALRTALGKFGQSLAAQIDVRFDSVASSADVAVSQLEVPSDTTLPTYVVLLAKGSVPDQSRSVTWRYGLVYSTY